MTKIWMNVFLKYQSSTMLQRKDIVNLIPKLPSNGNCEAMVTSPTAPMGRAVGGFAQGFHVVVGV